MFVNNHVTLISSKWERLMYTLKNKNIDVQLISNHFFNKIKLHPFLNEVSQETFTVIKKNRIF